MKLNLEKALTLKSTSVIFIFLGVLSFLFVFFPSYQDRVWHSYLLSYVFFLLLSLSGLFFISVHHSANAYWSATTRRLAEALTSYLFWALVLVLPLLLGAFTLYDWLSAEKVAEDPLLLHKKNYLNFPFFLIRTALFLGGWWFFAKKFLSFSLKQDVDGLDKWNQKSVKYSILFLLFFALSLSLFSVDFLMSLDAHWFSTIFGVYVFAGLFQSAFAGVIILGFFLVCMDEKYKKWITEDHLHDLGKFLFAATVFWAYIAFSQYMLIWYANLPEETTFFIYRSKGAWSFVSISLIVFKFILPFFILLPRWTKRKRGLLTGVAGFILFMQFVDLYWLIYPAYDLKTPRFGFLELGIFLGFAGVFIRALWNFFEKHPPVPLKDPKLEKSLKHKVTY